MSRKVRRQFPGASPYKDRHGKRRWRYRKKGISRELGTTYGSPEFIEKYEAAVAEVEAPPGAAAGKTIPRSISALIAEYYRSAEFLDLKSSTKTTYRGIIERFREEHGTKRVATLQRRHLRRILGAKSNTPSAANNLRDRLKALLDLAVDLEWRKDNPVTTIKPYKIRSKGFHTWTEEEIERYYEVHEFGTQAHTAMTLMLYTGAAKVDAVKLGRGNVKNGRLKYRRQKTEDNSDIVVDIPVHPELQRVIDNLSPDAFTFLETQSGKSRSPNGLGNAMRKWCDAAKLSNCTSHGLRKAIARRLAEAGATPHEIMSVTGHATLAEVTRYTVGANRGNLADDAFGKLK